MAALPRIKGRLTLGSSTFDVHEQGDAVLVYNKAAWTLSAVDTATLIPASPVHVPERAAVSVGGPRFDESEGTSWVLPFKDVGSFSLEPTEPVVEGRGPGLDTVLIATAAGLLARPLNGDGAAVAGEGGSEPSWPVDMPLGAPAHHDLERFDNWDDALAANDVDEEESALEAHRQRGARHLPVTREELTTTLAHPARVTERQGTTMDFSEMTSEERLRLASDPATDFEVLDGLSRWGDCRDAVLANPSTPHGTRERVYATYPYLRPRTVQPRPQDPAFADAAIGKYRERQVTRAPGALGGSYTPASGAVPYRTVQLTDVNGQTVTVPAAYASPGTSGLAVASFITSMLGISLVGVILGHAAKSQIARTGEGGAGFATAGLVLGYGAMLVWVVLLLGALGA